MILIRTWGSTKYSSGVRSLKKKRNSLQVTKSKHVYVDDSKTKNAFSIEIMENDIPRRLVPAEELKGI